jgi:hypothetical protein
MKVLGFIMGKSITLFSAILVFATTLTFAQSGTGSSGVQSRADDAFREMNTGQFTLRFINALTGDFVSGAAVTIGNNSYTTDFEGKVLFTTDVVNGQLPVSFRKADFIGTDFNLEIMVGSVWQNQISVSPALQPQQIRIVLDWADRPRDLDAHLIKEGDYHISYRDTRTSQDGTAQLDRDDTNGNGPETITINEMSVADTYVYKVMDYSNRDSRRSRNLASQSRATVRVYGDNRLMHTYRIDGNSRGTEWTVFRIENGIFTRVDTVD